MDERSGLLALAERQLAANRQRGVGAASGLPYDFVCPSRSHYPFQWFWDSCFHAIALTHIDVRLAEQELRCLLQGQRADGFMPHMLFWDQASYRAMAESYNLPKLGGWTSDITQTPMLAAALRRVYEAGRSRTFLEQTLPAAVRCYDWLRRNRDPDGDGLLSILQPDESGLDASPKYDRVLGLTEPTEAGLRAAMQGLFDRYAPLRSDNAAMLALDAFNVEDVLVNTVYADNLRDLAALLREAGDAVAAHRYEDEAARTLAALLSKCWDEGAGAFWDLAGAAEEPQRVLTITSLFPLLLGDLPAEIAAKLVKHVTDEGKFWARVPVRSVAAREPSYDPGEGIIWRGPVWLNTNWFLIRGLRRHGYDAEAETIAAASRELVLRHGFREYYNPETGAPGGAVGFGWSTLVIDM
ncbi:MAG TPA: trehalase family glycosidase [Dehalococcoidia bacterium]|nr:trehalase family glycosidase [Dehalococcoidia bacterium]